MTLFAEPKTNKCRCDLNVIKGLLSENKITGEKYATKSKRFHSAIEISLKK